jgi:hypothetical protein
MVDEVGQCVIEKAVGELIGLFVAGDKLRIPAMMT